MPPVQSMVSSPDSSKTVVGRGTSTRVGESKTTAPSMQPQMQPSFKWKPDSDQASFSTSTTSKEQLFSTYDETSKRKHEMEGFLQTEETKQKKRRFVQTEETKQKKSRPVRKIVLNENHMELRAAVEAGSKWEEDLESVHGLSDVEAAVCVGLVAKYDKHETFPESETDGKNSKYLGLAREGWFRMRELKHLMVKYPQENCDQHRLNGVWHLRPGPTLKDLEQKRKATMRPKVKTFRARHNPANTPDR